jgi:AcrR family transcriptional regulator
MRALTERQIRRRENILAAARKLLAEHGVEGVTMRELARESGVTPKTLYHLFESKEKLLLTAVEERFRYLYQMINEAQIDRGIDRLFYIIDTAAETTRKNLAYAKALVPILTSASESPITEIRKAAYRRAVLQIAEEGEFLDWVDVNLMNRVIYQQVMAVGQGRWYERETAKRPSFSLAKLDVSLVLRSVTTGYTHRRATEVIREIQAKFNGS